MQQAPGWRLHWIDYTGHKFGAAPPKPQSDVFPTREAAEAARARKLITMPGLVSSIVPLAAPRAPGTISALIDLPVMHKRLTT